MLNNLSLKSPSSWISQSEMKLLSYVVSIIATLSVSEVLAVSNIFTGLQTFSTAVITILAAAVIVGLVVLLIVSLSQGQVNWGPILFGLLAVVFIAGIAANVPGFFATLGINVQAAGASYSELSAAVN